MLDDLEDQVNPEKCKVKKQAYLNKLLKKSLNGEALRGDLIDSQVPITN